MAVPLESKQVTEWCRLGKEKPRGVCVPSVLACPAAVTVVIALNDNVTRQVLDSVGKVVATNSSVLTMGVRNKTLVDWQIGFVGKSETRQILFDVDEGSADEFSILGIYTGITYGSFGAASSCSEISVRVSQKSQSCGQPEQIRGRIEIRDESKAWGGSEYVLSLDA